MGTDPSDRRRFVLATVAVGLLMAMIACVHDGDPDIWGRMAIARAASASGSLVLPRDVFSWTAPGAPWVDHEWGFNWIAYGVHALGGWGALRLLRIAALAATMALALSSLARAWPRFLPLAAAWIGFALAIGASGPRAQAFTFVFFAWELACLERSRRDGPRWILLAVAPMPLWVNVHGGFLAGIAILVAWSAARVVEVLLAQNRATGSAPDGTAAASRRDHTTLLWIGGAIGLAAVSTIVNPWGVAFPGFLVRTATMPRPFIPEWAPPKGVLAGLAATFILGAIAAAARAPRRVPEWIALALTAYAAAAHQRHLPFLAIGLAVFAFPVLAEWRASARPGAMPEPARAARDVRAWTGFCVLLAIAAMFVALRPADERRDFPVDALGWMRDHGVKGNLLCEFDWAQYVLWRDGDRFKVAFDGRYEETYPEQIQKAFFAFHSKGDGWQTLPEDPRAEVALVRAGSTEAKELSSLADWQPAFSDAQSAVFTRRRP